MIPKPRRRDVAYGPGVSARDRSPIRWNSPHPSLYVAHVGAEYIGATESAGQREKARWAVARMLTLDRVTPLPADLRAWFNMMREELGK